MESGKRLTLAEVAVLLDVDAKTVKRLIAAHRFPPGWRHGRSRFWWEKDVESYLWLASQNTFGPLPPEPKRKAGGDIE
jgi:predicted DNA-binding transcriptional regulator AlpA